MCLFMYCSIQDVEDIGLLEDEQGEHFDDDAGDVKYDKWAAMMDELENAADDAAELCMPCQRDVFSQA